ncbi:tyrosine-type recombinase/integrase [Enterobacter hormaechei]|uniref:tyrosine-type recombinase/integrase n=1 Tax=Enterobacteriaceae TaxID=543 RepID=UPI0022375076|nr:tyrosine-type recombinase/integrase [Enterobacter hormaechei]MCW4755564.1 tyrosine-type recombinase/integrase [Enterobacter hormaechei]
MPHTKSYFSGPFAPMCEVFVTQRRAMGRQYKQQAMLLRMFDNFSKSYNIRDFTIPQELASAWSRKRPNEAESSRYSRVGEMLRFAEFLSRQGYPSYLPQIKTSRKSLHVPYIFTAREIDLILNYVSSLEPTNASPVMHLSLPTIIKILYGSGLRISEALALQVRDVDLDRGVLHIRRGKNDRERLVPLSTSLAEICRAYAAQALKGVNDFAPFFFNRRREPYSAGFFGKHFRQILWEVGIPYRGKDRGPRLHDLRHTFVCHRLNKWADENADLNAMLPVLSAYLGHSNLNSTYYYLKLTAEVYPNITSALEAKVGHIFPEINHLIGETAHD